MRDQLQSVSYEQGLLLNMIIMTICTSIYSMFRKLAFIILLRAVFFFTRGFATLVSKLCQLKRQNSP